MCGIAGYIGIRKHVSENAVKNTFKLMKNRGPDSSGIFFRDIGKKNSVMLMHTRLSIIDLNNRSNQPFIRNNVVLVFNGEIYNYIELREILKKKGFKFTTNSDTEVVINSYIAFGENFVKYFNGMWSLAIWDMRKEKLFLSRDLFGEKPMFYYKNNQGLFFGSEIKFIKELSQDKFEVNYNRIANNLGNGYKSLFKNYETYFKKIYALEPSSNLKIDKNLKINNSKFWKPKLNIDKNLSLQDCIEKSKNFLFKSIEKRLRSDVSLSLSLSGGIDSALLASIIDKEFGKRIKTFSIIDDDERYDESNNIDLIKKDLNHHNVKIKISKKKLNFFKNMDSIVKYHDAPISTISSYISNFITKKVSKSKCKVIYSGVGADEIFSGYYDHFLLNFREIKNQKGNFNQELKFWKKFNCKSIRNKNLKNFKLYIDNPKFRDNIYETYFKNFSFLRKFKNQKFYEINYCNNLFRNRMMNEMFNEIVPVILFHDDLNSMMYSVENRSPYLDKDLFNFSLKIPSKYLIKHGYQKFILRSIAKDYLPFNVAFDRKKVGFNASIQSFNFDVILKLNDLKQSKNEINDLIDIGKVVKNIEKNGFPNHISKLVFSIFSINSFLKNI